MAGGWGNQGAWGGGRGKGKGRERVRVGVGVRTGRCRGRVV